MELEALVQYIDRYLGVSEHPDYPTALNGLQVEGRKEVRHLCAAVDASEAAILQAARQGADLLLVHHGMFWEGLRAVTGPRYRKLATLMSAEMALYSVHLPLDSHPEVGNCALLGARLGLEPGGRFAPYKGVDIGWWGTTDADRTAFTGALEVAVGGPVRLIPGGGDRIRTVGIVTGGGGSLIPAAVAAGFDAYVTGEGSHHTFIDAMEAGLNLFYAGHYATETFGVKALAEHLASTFDLSWDFIDLPTGM